MALDRIAGAKACYHQLTDDLDDLMVSSATIAPTFGVQPLARGAGRAECPGT